MKNLIKMLSIIFFIFFLSVPVFGEEIKNIQIVTPAWENQTNEDGTGLFFDIVRSVYEPAGIRVEYKIVPWKRAKHLISRNKTDAMLCVAVQNIGSQLIPKYPMIKDYTAVVFKKDRIKEWKGIESLKGKAAIWRRGYDFHLNPNMKGIELKEWSEFDDYTGAWNILKKERTDFYIDALVDIRFYIKRNHLDTSPYQIKELWGENLYMCFSVSERSKKLIEIYDKRIIEAVNSGELKKIFEKWDIYPFSNEIWKN